VRHHSEEQRKKGQGWNAGEPLGRGRRVGVIMEKEAGGLSGFLALQAWWLSSGACMKLDRLARD